MMLKKGDIVYKITLDGQRGEVRSVGVAKLGREYQAKLTRAKAIAAINLNTYCGTVNVYI